MSKPRITTRTLKRERAVNAIFSQPTNSSAAKAAGVSEATLRRWLRQESFQEMLEAARRDRMEDIAARLRQLRPKAIKTLQGIMANDSAPASCRLRAARMLLEYSNGDQPRVARSRVSEKTLGTVPAPLASH